MTDLHNTPILYINKEELSARQSATAAPILEGHALERKDEQVFHTRLGEADDKRSIPCYFLKGEATVPSVPFPFFVIYADAQKAYLFDKFGAHYCAVHFLPGKEDLYSRSKGLLETGLLAKKHVLIIGLGSFGSFIAVELAKAGIGNFTLIDFDRVESANIARHVCGIDDLGRLKVNAVRDAIHQKNPFAAVATVAHNINHHPEELKDYCRKADIIICVTDNNRSRFNINQAAIELNKTVLFGRAITRAEGGDVFRLSGNSGPCYCCLIGDDGKMKYSGEEEISSSRQTDDLPAYVSEEERDAVVQPGLSIDILPICNQVLKLAIAELSGTSDELSYPFYIWANRREKFYANWSAFDEQDKRPTILRWYGVRIPKDPGCMICS